MRPWARWTAGMALAAVVSGAAGGGLSGIALAGTSGDSSSSSLAPLSGPVDVCGDASALLGIALPVCRSGAAASVEQPRGVVGHIVRTPSTITSTSTTAPAGASATHSRGTTTGDRGASSASTVFRSPATSKPDSAFQDTFGDTLNAPGTTDGPGVGTLPGLADLPSVTGLTATWAGRGSAGGTLVPGTALTAADAAGMSTDSFAALAIGALLAGAAALKIASRRARDRKAEIGAAI
jgi:hypothetical protein